MNNNIYQNKEVYIMYYNSYEEYMRDVLGYTRNRENSNNTYYVI